MWYVVLRCMQMNSGSHRHYPAYHTVIDNSDYMEQFVDPSFSAHVSITQLAADIILQMSSSVRLPLDVRELADTLELEYDSLQQDGMENFNYLLGNIPFSVLMFFSGKPGLADATWVFPWFFLHLFRNYNFKEKWYRQRCFCRLAKNWMSKLRVCNYVYIADVASTTTTTVTVSRLLHRSAGVNWHPQLRTAGLYSRVLPAFPCWRHMD